MKPLPYRQIEEPNKNYRKLMYDLYLNVYESPFILNKKRNLMTEILGRENWSWRVVGISRNAVTEIITGNYKKDVTKKLERDHYFQDRRTTYTGLFENKHSFDDWWKKCWEGDKTILMTKLEHKKKLDIEIIDLDWKLGLFQCSKQAGFEYTQGREGFYIKENYSLKI